MTDDQSERDARVASDDLAIVGELAVLRLQLRAPESRRRQCVDDVVVASVALSRALSAHAQRSKVIDENSRTPADLSAETADVVEAMRRYAAVIHEVATEFRSLVRGRSGLTPTSEVATRLLSG